MKKIIMIALIVSFSMIINGATAFADWSFQLDNLDNIDGDSTETYEVKFVTTEALNLENYQLNFKYDNTEMQYTSYTHPSASGLDADMMGQLYEIEPGTLHNLNAGTFGPGADLEAGTELLLATISFDVFDSPPSVKDGNDDLWFNPIDSVGFGTTIDSVWYAFKIQPPEFLAAHLSYGPDMDAVGAPVPIPGAVWLLGSGFLGLIGIRKKNRK
jgi:hypothetical protein